MPKIKCLVRNPDNYMRETKQDLFKVKRNYDPNLHPFEAQREYVRALNAVKLERVFAKPFIGNLDGHRDGVSALAKHSSRLSLLASGAYDGELKLWDLASKTCRRSVQAHDGGVRGVIFTSDGHQMISVGDDKTIKTWNVESPAYGEEDLPTNTIISKNVLLGISHSKESNIYATCGEVCEIWEETRSEPLKSLSWGADSLQHVSFSPVESNVLSTCGNDNSIVLYDMRQTGPVRKVVLALRTNQIAWNPMEAYHFVAANEDYNLYTFDMRNLSEALLIHTDHTSAVISVDFSPTGLEFASGSYDKTIRIFAAASAKSRDIYHTKRMQKISQVAWSLDDKYIISASDEMNIRIWKAVSNDKIGVMLPREKKARDYHAALLKKFEHYPQIRKIATHRQVPKHVYNARKQHKLIRDSEKRRENNLRSTRKPGKVPVVNPKAKNIVEEKE